MEFSLLNYFSAEMIDRLLRIGIILVVGSIIISSLAYVVRRSITRNMTRQSRMVVNRVIVYTGFTLLAFIIISEMKIDLTALFGAAGVVGIVIGIASQTSIGNIISGFFLVSEKSFEIGDQVRLGDKVGIVYSVDLLSIKIRTHDNLLIRVPNQTVISTELVNVTRFPIRRLDLTVSVAYKEDLRKVVEVLQDVAAKNPLCLEEPAPLILFQQFGSSSIDILFALWFEKTNFVKLKNSIFVEIKEAFDREGIEIPFPHISVYAGEATKPLPVRWEERPQKTQ